MKMKDWNKMTLDEQNEYWGIPKGVRWTIEFPKENGWYFAKYNDCNIIYFGHVRIINKDSLEMFIQRMQYSKFSSNEDVEWCHIDSVNGD